MLDINLETVVILLWLVIFFNYELLKSLRGINYAKNKDY